MNDEWTTPLTVEQMYGDWDVEWDEATALTDQSLNPRPKTSMFDTLATLGIGAENVVLDIGGRDATDGLAIAARFGCRVIVVDPVQLNIDDGKKAVASHDQGDLVDVRLGTINQIPIDDDTVDVVFSRDMLTHIEDLDGALAECRRVLTASRFNPRPSDFRDAIARARRKGAHLCGPRNCARPALRRNLRGIGTRSGFAIQAVDRIGSEWLESFLEREDGEKRLLRAARMRRAKDDIVAKVGVTPFRVMEANNLWTIYRMIGKLEERLYTLTLDAS